MEAESLLVKIFAGSSICQHVLANPSQSSTATPPNRLKDTIDSSSPSALSASEIPIRRIPSSLTPSAPPLFSLGAPVSANTTAVVVSQMAFKNFRSTGSDSYITDFEVSFDPPPKTVRNLKPITIQNLNISTDPMTPANAKGIISCSLPSGPAPSLRRFTFISTTPGVTETFSWTVPAGVSSALVSMAGGGGSGFGWRTPHAVQSGHSGGFIMLYPVSLIAGETLSITVGKGGTSFGAVDTGTMSAFPPHHIWANPPGDDGLAGYPGDASKIVSPSMGLILECAGGSGAYSFRGMDNYSGWRVAGNLAGAIYGSGNESLPGPSRPASGPYAQPTGPGKCGPGPADLGIGTGGQVQFSSIPPTVGPINSGNWPGGKTPLGYGSGGDIATSGCYVSATLHGLCVFPNPGRDGVVHIDVFY